jgi:glycerol uptake facilitator-like aquaporin
MPRRRRARVRRCGGARASPRSACWPRSSAARARPQVTPYAAALFIVAGYWFTASSSFANPALTLARAATGTCAGIRLADVPGYVLAQLAGAAVATAVVGWLYPRAPVPATASRLEATRAVRQRAP